MSKEMLTLAAELLRQGGTLLSEPCNICNGVQVKFKDEIICVNCSRKINLIQIEKSNNTDIITKLRAIIIRKIEELMPILLNERDLTRQLDITRLVNNYLELLNKIDNTKG